MLKLMLSIPELYDEKTQEFIPAKKQVVQLEHSLVSLRKWESKWCEPFITRKDRSREKWVDYVKCMTLTQNVDPLFYHFMSDEQLMKVIDYINAPMTATTFSKDDKTPNREVITAEIIYYWMIALNIPFECQKWHLNSLLTLVNVCNIKNAPKKKMNKRELMNRNRALNASRRQSLGSKG